MAQQGFMTGATTGAMAGFAVGGPVGAGIGFFAGGVFGSESEDDAEAARVKAEREAEKKRREAVVNQMNVKQQSDNLAFSASNKNSGGAAAAQAEGVIGAPTAPGSIVSNMTSSGTF